MGEKSIRGLRGPYNLNRGLADFYAWLDSRKDYQEGYSPMTWHVECVQLSAPGHRILDQTPARLQFVSAAINRLADRHQEALELKYLPARHPNGIEVTDIDRARVMDITVVKFLNLIRVGKRKIKDDLNQPTVN